VKAELSAHRVRLRTPLHSSTGAVEARDLVLLRLADDDGVCGFGEAAPLPGYHDVGAPEVLAALERCLPLLRDADGRERDTLWARCAELTALPQALAAIDLALWDLAGRRAGLPVWRLLGADSAPGVEVNATVGAVDRSGAAREAAAAATAGFRAVKVKVGVGDDADRLAAMRAAAGREMEIRIDANGAWGVHDAIAALRTLEPVGIECCEEPAHGVEAIARVAAASAVPVSLDESATEPGALERRACEAVCLKISACGGVTGLVRAAARARLVGYTVYLSSTIDGPLGIAAALHAAAVIRPDRACGLATLALMSRGDDLLAPAGGLLAAPTSPGLGGPWLDFYDFYELGDR
jgi:L-alanine-DL-glutamate epimerase-like enolase superfamily enzyme